MQFQLFFDYEAIVNSCSFTRKYDALFRAFDKVCHGFSRPALGAKAIGNWDRVKSKSQHCTNTGQSETR